MYLYIFLYSLIIFAKDTVQQEDALPVWPETYSLRGLKLNLMAKLSQPFQYWRKGNSSRLDMNNGAVKTFYFENSTKEDYGAIYKVHPQTNSAEENEITCTWAVIKQKTVAHLRVILPKLSEDNFEFEGTELILGKNTSKFVSSNIDYDEATDDRKTLWAHFDNTTQAWIPDRYEDMQFSTWYGSLKKHYLWIYDNVELDFNDSLLNETKYVKTCKKGEAGDVTVAEHQGFLDPENDDHVEHSFKSFKRRNQRKYTEHDIEHHVKKEIFKKNMKLVVDTNRQNLTYKLALNHLADHTPEEMMMRKGLRRTVRAKGNIPFPYTELQLKNQVENLPKEYDLRLLGLVSPVEEQVTCGCCWTWGTTTAVEGALARSNGGRLLSLSNQALIDCAWSTGNAGCNGGADTTAYQWMMEYGLPTVAEYGPYNDADGFCNISNMTKLYPIKGFTDVTPFSVDALKVALINHGPLSISVQASDAFSLYSSGIFYDPKCSPTALDHEISLVGYGEEDGEGFWVVKNSWGTEWGIDGFMHISMRDNNCGVATEPTYVVF